MSLDTLADAFYEELQDVLSAERQLLKALPKMAKKATNFDLKEAIETHLKETQDQVKRLEEAFGEAATKDAMIIACAQKVEHYEIATYGTLCTWAETLGYTSADKLLTKLSVKINNDALAEV